MPDSIKVIAGLEVLLDHRIAGKRVASSSRFPNASSIDGSDLGSVSAGGKLETDMAVETADNGSLLMGNIHRTIPRAAQNKSFFADWVMTLHDPAIDHEEVANNDRYDPSGVSALTTPWNAPLMLTTWKVGPALQAGLIHASKACAHTSTTRLYRRAPHEHRAGNTSTIA